MGADMPMVRRAGLLPALICVAFCSAQGPLHAGPADRAAGTGEPAREIAAAEINSRLEGAAHTDGQAGRDRSKKTRLLVMKEFLQELPPDERAKVLGSFVLVNGAVAFFYVGPLRARLRPETVAGKVRALSGSFRENLPERSREARRHAELSALLRYVPEKTRNEFLDSLVLEDGVLVSAKVGGLRRRMDDARLKNILDRLAYDSHEVPGIKSFGAVCGNGWCTHSACVMLRGTVKEDDRPAAAPADKDTVCYSACGKF